MEVQRARMRRAEERVINPADRLQNVISIDKRIAQNIIILCGGLIILALAILVLIVLRAIRVFQGSYSREMNSVNVVTRRTNIALD